MAGETDLEKLLATMEPRLVDGRFVFAVAASDTVPKGLNPIATIREAEGLTLILPEDEARGTGMTCSDPMRQISLSVHSALAAVGLTAAFATELASHGISANVVAGYYHDHIFVGVDDAERALRALKRLAARHS